MALPDIEVRHTTAAAITAALDTSLTGSAAAQAGRAALTPLPDFRTGDALTSAIRTAAAPDRIAVYDRRTRSALLTLGITVSHAPGRYARYIEAIEQLLTAAPDPVRHDEEAEPLRGPERLGARYRCGPVPTRRM